MRKPTSFQAVSQLGSVESEDAPDNAGALQSVSLEEMVAPELCLGRRETVLEAPTDGL